MGSSASEAKNRSQVVTGLFRDKESAERAYDSLTTRGYGQDDVNVIMSDETRKKFYPEGRDSADSDFDSKALESVGAGSAIGDTAGAVNGAIAAIGTNIALPGLGLVVAGPIAGAGVGAAAGGLVSGLKRLGVAEEHADFYAETFRPHVTRGAAAPTSSDDPRTGDA